MKYYLSIVAVLTLLLALACDSETTPINENTKITKVIESFPDSIPKLVYEYYDNNPDELFITHYYENGQIEMQGNSLDGERFGKWAAWDEEGRILSTGHYDAGIENGMWTVWFPNGIKRYEGRYVQGERVGVWKFWDNEGELTKEIEY